MDKKCHLEEVEARLGPAEGLVQAAEEGLGSGAHPDQALNLHSEALHLPAGDMAGEEGRDLTRSRLHLTQDP